MLLPLPLIGKLNCLSLRILYASLADENNILWGQGKEKRLNVASDCDRALITCIHKYLHRHVLQQDLILRWKFVLLTSSSVADGLQVFFFLTEET